jgi:hypothetical protein
MPNAQIIFQGAIGPNTNMVVTINGISPAAANYFDVHTTTPGSQVGLFAPVGSQLQADGTLSYVMAISNVTGVAASFNLAIGQLP